MDRLQARVATCLCELYAKMPTRAVGSSGNRAAAAPFERLVTARGSASRCPEFDCMDWHEVGAEPHRSLCPL